MNFALKNAVINDITHKNRVEWAIFYFEKFKCPGPDQIYPIMLQKAWCIIDKHLRNIYKACLNQCYVPKNWQKVKVIFIPKPGKEDYTSPKSFRPISLTSTMLKGLERLVDRHIKDELERLDYLHCSQHAFQEGKSTETALHKQKRNSIKKSSLWAHLWT